MFHLQGGVAYNASRCTSGVGGLGLPEKNNPIVPIDWKKREIRRFWIDRGGGNLKTFSRYKARSGHNVAVTQSMNSAINQSNGSLSGGGIRGRRESR